MNMFNFFLIALIPGEISYSDIQQLKHMLSFESGHRWCSVKKVFLKVLQISQENTYVGVSS